MTKGRTPPPPPGPADHAAALRERLGKIAHDAWFAAIGATPAPAWEDLPADIKTAHRSVGDAVMRAIVKRGDRRGSLSVASSFGYDTQQPYVELTVDTSPTQLSPAKAREIALMLLEAADAAESDAVLMQFAKEHIGLDAAQAAELLDLFRQLRKEWRGKRTDAA